MRLRPATIADLVLLRTWDAEPHNIAAIGTEGPFDWEHEISHQSAWSEVLIAELRGRPIGVVQIIDPAREETHYWGDVEPHLRAIDIWIGAATDL
ncbi:MAG: acetyltransferase, partial [Alphaproteobacteria bacterium]|nr:acetyltransferase [Alphaproteobacteria bacterium]